MFLIYGDESLDETQSRVCAVGALVGIEEDWADLEAKWKALHGEVPFHANDCDSDHGDFAVSASEDADLKHKANKALYRGSIHLLASSGIGGFASAYDLAAQREAFPPPHQLRVYYQPFLEVLEKMYVFLDNNRGFSKLTFDSRIESEHNAGLMYARIRENNPEWRERFADEISFVSSRSNIRIQIADLFAREAMKDFDNEIGPKKRPTRKSWECLNDTGRFFLKKTSKEYFEPARRNMLWVQESFHITQDDFAKWLTERNRQWSYTNWNEFMEWSFSRASQELKDEYERTQRYE